MEEKSLELQIIEEMSKRDKTKTRLINKLVVALVLVTATSLFSVCFMHISTLNFLSQYEYSTVTVDEKDGGNAIYQNSSEGDNIINGESDSKENGKKEAEEN